MDESSTQEKHTIKIELNKKDLAELFANEMIEQKIYANADIEIAYIIILRGER